METRGIEWQVSAGKQAKRQKGETEKLEDQITGTPTAHSVIKRRSAWCKPRTLNLGQDIESN